MGNDMDSLRLKINIPFCGGVPLKKRKFIVSEFRAKNPSPLTFNLFFFFLHQCSSRWRISCSLTL